MKHTKPIHAMTLGLALLAGGAIGAFAQSVGFNFAGGYNDHEINNTDPDSLAVTELAGAPGFKQTNWNNGGRYGGVTSGIVDSIGTATALVINWDAVNIFSSGAYQTLGTSDAKLMDDLISPDWANGPAAPITGDTSVYSVNADAKPIVFIGGLQAWLAQEGAVSYKIVLYVNGWHNYNGTSEYWIESVTGSSIGYSMVPGADLTPHLFSTDTGPFNGTWNQVSPTSTSAANRSVGGNYMVFSGLTNNEVLIRSSEVNGDYQTVTLFGFQIVPVFPGAPPDVSGPGASPSSTLYAGSPTLLTEVASGNGTLTYQWQTDGGSGGSLTNIPGATATNLLVRPPDTGATYNIAYDVIVSSSFGSSTSAVTSLTVNPASAPLLTQDIQPGTSIFAYLHGILTLNAAFDGTHPITNYWVSNSVTVLTATNNTFTLTNLPASAAGTYQFTATNAVGSLGSSIATVTIQPDLAAPNASEPYAYAVFTNHPVAYWRFSETGDNGDNVIQAYDFSGNGNDANYGSAVSLGQAGPQSPAFPGFESANTAVALGINLNNSFLTSPSLNLNTNTVTFTAWINPNYQVVASAGLFTWLNGVDKAGFGFGGNVSNGVAELGYVWNTNSPGSYNYHSGLYPPAGQWSFVAATITPTNTTLYLYYVDQNNGNTNLFKSVQLTTNGPEAFGGGTSWIGTDTSAARIFNGSLAEVAVFGHSLSEVQIQNLFLTAIGAAGVVPNVTLTTAAVNTYVGVPVTFNAVGGGAPPPIYQWQTSSDGVTFVNLVNGPGISGNTTPTLTISNIGPANAYIRVVGQNIIGSSPSTAVPVTLTPIPAQGQWTVNFAVVNQDNNNPGVAYSGRGILGVGNYWNAYNAYDGTVTASYLDDGITPSSATLSMANLTGEWSYSPVENIHLLSAYVSCDTNAFPGTSATTATFGNIPNGTYNLALYGIDGGWADRAVTYTVNGVSQTIVNVQDVYFTPGDNTVLFASVTVTNGQLQIGLESADSPKHNSNTDGTPNTEGEFNGGQLQLVQAVGNPARISNVGDSGGNLVIKGVSPDVGQSYRILSTTNLTSGVWTPVATNVFVTGGFTNSIPVNSTNPQSFYRVVEP